MSLHIRLDNDILITSDSDNVVLNRIVITKEGDNKGKERIEVLGYYPDLVQALEALLNKTMQESTARSLKTLCTEHTAFVGYLRKAIGCKGALT